MTSVRRAFKWEGAAQGSFSLDILIGYWLYMLTLDKRIETFAVLGRFLKQFSRQGEENPDLKKLNDEWFAATDEHFRNAHIYNPWFTEEFVRIAVEAISYMLEENKLRKWISIYNSEEFDDNKQTKQIGVVMAGNIPLVGFHDFLCVLLSGYTFQGKLSSKDQYLMKLMADLVCAINSDFADRIILTEERLSNFDAIIATGSDNSARYFEYYFGKYPNIIRKNRTSVAVITGNENESELSSLADDVFLYFGLGCRNVSRFFVPAGYNFGPLFKAFEKYSYLGNHNKFANNYEYNRAIYLVNQTKHLDGGFFIMKEDSGLFSPLTVYFYDYYSSPEHLESLLTIHKQGIQALVTSDQGKEGAVTPGRAQYPEPWDYADGVDTMAFLLSLNKS
ncbi:MAG TPA: hypothetical protein VE912_12680 [Bacteroidales bacterium]|nr:hypothetical protein [Bacteroidales bacterium]